MTFLQICFEEMSTVISPQSIQNYGSSWVLLIFYWKYHYCVESTRIWSFSGLYFPAFGLNTDQKNSEYGHFSCSAVIKGSIGLKTTINKTFKNMSYKSLQKKKTKKNRSFPLRIYSVNVTKSTVFCGLLKKSLMEIFIFCAVTISLLSYIC